MNGTENRNENALKTTVFKINSNGVKHCNRKFLMNDKIEKFNIIG